MKLSVLMITYNHEAFIAQAIESILLQEVNFDYEIVIGEDCSTDNTRKILLNYQEKYPDKIRLILPENNLGMQKNFSETFKSCQGKYIALLEGDDYWISSNKLQKQVDFLEKNSEYIICFHNAWVKHTESKNDYFMNSNINKDVFDITDIIKLDWFIATASMVFRNNIIELPDWLDNLMVADMPLQLLLSEHGKFKYLDEVMSVYRRHENGINVWFSQHYYTKVIPNKILMYSYFHEHTQGIYKRDILYQIKRHLSYLCTTQASFECYSSLDDNSSQFIKHLNNHFIKISLPTSDDIKEFIVSPDCVTKLTVQGLLTHGNFYYINSQYSKAFDFYYKVLQLDTLNLRAIAYCFLLLFGSLGRSCRAFVSRFRFLKKLALPIA
ncbi:glycosyltransferase [Nostoc linckia FACHB-104]|nr:glycosyltransferase [Nostoc linckia FACHB-104]